MKTAPDRDIENFWTKAVIEGIKHGRRELEVPYHDISHPAALELAQKLSLYISIRGCNYVFTIGNSATLNPQTAQL